MTTHIDDFLVCGEKGVPDSARFRAHWQGTNSAHIGMEALQGKYYSATMTRQKFTDALQSTPNAKKLRASR